jgi:hypothetical protein
VQVRARPLRRPPAEATDNLSAIANSRNAKPNDARSTANGLATNTSGEVQADAAAGSRGVAEASGEIQEERAGLMRHKPDRQ